MPSSAERALDQLADGHRVLVGTVHEQLPVAHLGGREAGSGEQLLRLVEIEGIGLVIGRVRRRARRCPGQGGDHAEAGIADPQDGLAVEQIVEGLAELLVLEGAARRVDAEDLHERAGALDQLEAAVAQPHGGAPAAAIDHVDGIRFEGRGGRRRCR